jgi:chemotaxis protein methyltransferase CheR
VQRDPKKLNGPRTFRRGLTDSEFLRLTEFVRERTGFSVSGMKKVMLQSRLLKRVRALKLGSYTEYCDFLFSHSGAHQEIGNFLNAVTTNKTDFFRESHHFDYLVRQALPALRQQGILKDNHLNVWSAACSSGMEAYSIGMVLAEEAARNAGFTWSILGTDISTNVLDKARLANYSEDEVETIESYLRHKYLFKSKSSERRVFTIVPEIRNSVEFRFLNFMDLYFDLPVSYEIIFCRNALIYFDQATQMDIVKKLTKHLVPGGFLFVGHSESLKTFPGHLTDMGSTIYRKPVEGMRGTGM